MKLTQLWKLGMMAVATMALSAVAASAQPAPAGPTPAPTPASTPAPTTPSGPAQPSTPIRPYIVLSGKEAEEKFAQIGKANKADTLIGGAGMQLKVDLQHETGGKGGTVELHDTSDDIYYILEGSAIITLGGRLENPKEVAPGEWRAARTIGGTPHEVHQGDLIVVPRGTPHVRNTEGRDLKMILIKIYQDPLPGPAPKASAAPAVSGGKKP